jgi:hypothetical protein
LFSVYVQVKIRVNSIVLSLNKREMFALEAVLVPYAFAKLSMISVLALTATLLNKTGQNGVLASV